MNITSYAHTSSEEETLHRVTRCTALTIEESHDIFITDGWKYKSKFFQITHPFHCEFRWSRNKHVLIAGKAVVWCLSKNPIAFIFTKFGTQLLQFRNTIIGWLNISSNIFFSCVTPFIRQGTKRKAAGNFSRGYLLALGSKQKKRRRVLKGSKCRPSACSE